MAKAQTFNMSIISHNEQNKKKHTHPKHWGRQNTIALNPTNTNRNISTGHEKEKKGLMARVHPYASELAGFYMGLDNHHTWGVFL